MTFLQLRLCRNIKTLSPSLSPSRLFVGNVTCNPSKERETGTNTKLTRSDCLISLLFHTSLKENSSRPCFYQYSRNKTPPKPSSEKESRPLKTETLSWTQSKLTKQNKTKKESLKIQDSSPEKRPEKLVRTSDRSELGRGNADFPDQRLVGRSGTKTLGWTEVERGSEVSGLCRAEQGQSETGAERERKRREKDQNNLAREPRNECGRERKKRKEESQVTHTALWKHQITRIYHH